MEYIGAARNVRELITLLNKADLSATLTFKGLDESWSYVEVWYDPEVNDVIIK